MTEPKPRKSWTENEVRRLNEDFERSDARSILEWAYQTLGRSAVIACSFGAEDVVLVDMSVKLFAQARIVTLDTGRLPEDTYRVMDAIRSKYGVRIDVIFPEARSVEELVGKKGLYSFRESIENRKECCRIRKVEPLKRALKGADAWITGLRRGQSDTRRTVPKAEIDSTQGGILKLSPLADWREEKVWEYIRANDVPYNRLHDLGYRSVGCAPCTRAVKPGEDSRSGRWWWERADHKECGLHPDQPG